MINIVSWNVNSIRARIEHLAVLAKDISPDIILLQETKVQDMHFPTETIEDMGYTVFMHGEKSYNGVAILSRGQIEDKSVHLPGDEDDLQSRYAECVTTIGGIAIRVASVYVPNGTSVKSNNFHYKLKFFERLREHFNRLRGYNEIFIAGGDYNVAPENIDVYDPNGLDGTLGFHMEERKRLRAILSDGICDSFRFMHPNTQEYSWWDYRSAGWARNHGMRIDHLLVSSQACDVMEDSGVYKQFRTMERPSDHVPIFCKLRNAEKSKAKHDI